MQSCAGIVGFSDVDKYGYIDMLLSRPDACARCCKDTAQLHRAPGANELSSDVSIAARPFLESIDPSGRGTLETRSPGSFRQLHPGWSVCRLERGRFLRQRYSAISCTFLSLCVMGPRPGSACSVSFTTGRLPERCQPKTSLRWGLSCLRPPGPVVRCRCRDQATELCHRGRRLRVALRNCVLSPV